MKDIIIGKVYFLLVRIKIKHMELNIIRYVTDGTRSSCAMGACVLVLARSSACWSREKTTPTNSIHTRRI